jgi:hypothetical protein
MALVNDTSDHCLEAALAQRYALVSSVMGITDQIFTQCGEYPCANSSLVPRAAHERTKHDPKVAN